MHPVLSVRSLALATFSLLAACGGGGSTTPVAPEPQPELNAAPVAVAGEYQHVKTGSLVYLDGSGSYDPDGDLITYAWTFASVPVGSTASLSEGHSAKPSFTADQAGDYVIRLVVSDGVADSEVAVTRVMAELENSKPVAHAGKDVIVEVGKSTTLDGSLSSDADGDALSYQWNVVNGIDVVALQGEDTVSPTVTASEPGSYTIRLIVSDGELSSDPVFVVVTVVAANVPPVAAAGADQNVLVGTVVALDGTGSHDPDGDAVTYQWTLVSVPEGANVSLLGSQTATPTFTPDVAGTYVLALVVNDGEADSVRDTVTVTAERGNTRPVARTNGNQSVVVGRSVLISGADSSDADGDPLTFAWRFVSLPSGSNAALVGAEGRDVQFIPDVVGDYVMELKVSDGVSVSEAAVVTITALADNEAPVAVFALSSDPVLKGTQVNLDGSASYDPDLDPLTYRWRVVARPLGSEAVIRQADRDEASITVDVAGDYVIGLVVNDGQLDSQEVTTTIHVVDSALTFEWWRSATVFDEEGWIKANIPFDAETSLSLANPGLHGQRYVIRSFRITAVTEPITITDVTVDTNANARPLSPLIDVGPSPVIQVGESRVIELAVTYQQAFNARITFSFDVVGVGRFEQRVTLNLN